MGTAALNTAPRLDASGVLTPALSSVLSMRFTPGPNALFNASSRDARAAASGRSPLRVMSLPLRTSDNGAKDSAGALTFGTLTVAFGSDGALTLGAPTLGALTLTFGSVWYPIAPNSNGTATKPNNQPNPGGRR